MAASLQHRAVAGSLLPSNAQRTAQAPYSLGPGATCSSGASLSTSALACSQSQSSRRGTPRQVLQCGLFNPLQIKTSRRNAGVSQTQGARGRLRVQAARQDAFVRVEAGDTLASLAQAFGVSRAGFLEANKDLISSENLIFEGDLLRVPAKAWSGKAPPGLEGRVVLRNVRGAGDMLAGVGTALHLLPSYVSLGTPQTTLPAGVGGWLILGGSIMVAFGALGKLLRGPAPVAQPPATVAPSPVRVVTERPEKALVLDKLGEEVAFRSYATPGMPKSMRGPYTTTVVNVDALPTQAMQASILNDPARIEAQEASEAKAASEAKEKEKEKAASEAKEKEKEKAALEAKEKEKEKAKAKAAAQAMEKEVAVQEQKRERQEEEKRRQREQEREQQKEIVAAQQKVVERLENATAKANAAAAAAKVLVAAAAAASAPTVAAEAGSGLETDASAVAVAQREEGGLSFQQRGRRLRDAIFGREKDTTVFTFATDVDSDTEDEGKVPVSKHAQHMGSAIRGESSPSTAWGPYSLGWAAEDVELESTQPVQVQGGGSTTSTGESAPPKELSAAQKAVQAALPAVALGIGAVSAVTTGWQGAMEAVGLAFVGSFVSYDLLWAEKRDELLKEVKGIRSPDDVAKFLEKRGILPK